MKTNSKTEAVKVENGLARLEITYKVMAPFEGSDSNVFSAVVGGDLTNLTEQQAKVACVKQARAWVAEMHSQGWEIGAWDNDGNSY